jgi:hypothetical protein
LKTTILALTILVFAGCGDNDADFRLDDSSEKKEEKIKVNPNFEIYDENCNQNTISNLCGFEGDDQNVPTFPCQDKVYCQ